MIRKAVIVVLTLGAVAALVADHISRQDHITLPIQPLLRLDDGYFAIKLGFLYGRCFFFSIYCLQQNSGCKFFTYMV